MKICLLSIVPIGREYEAATFDMLKCSFGAVLRADTEVVLQGPANGPAMAPEHLHDYRNAYFWQLVKNEIISAVLDAERAGFDAVVVNCFDDPGVAEARAVAAIPVFGLCEPALHYACQLGRRIGALVPDMPGQVAFVEDQFHQHGLANRLIVNGVRAESKPFIESMPEGMQQPETMARRLVVQGQQLVRDGADVVLIACGGLGQVCGMAGLHRIEVDGRAVPVVLPLTVAMKHAEMMLDMQRVLGLPIPSQAHAGRRLSEEDRARIQRGFGVE